MTNDNLIFDFENCALRLSTIGKINHQNAVKIRASINAKILELSPMQAILDLSQVNSMDTSGLGLFWEGINCCEECMQSL